MNAALSPLEVRVLASLLEKSMATPEYYPLTLSALTAACNQKSNRDPVLHLSEEDVVRALDSLRDQHLAWTVTMAGSRVPKYRHNVPQVFPLTPPQLAVLAELMLRGPQTVGELRTHAGRLAAFADTAEVQTVLNELAGREGGPLVTRLPRQTGKREEHYAQLLGGPPPQEEAPTVAPPPEPARLAVAAENERIAALEARVTALQDELAQVRAQFSDFAKQFQ